MQYLVFCENNHRWYFTDDPDKCPHCPMTEGYRHAVLKPMKIIGSTSNEEKANGD